MPNSDSHGPTPSAEQVSGDNGGALRRGGALRGGGSEGGGQ